MTALNHIAGGTVFTAFFASIFFGVNILTSPFTMAATVIASLLPDVDHTRSMIGKTVFPLARWLNRRYGHRTLTHGLPCMAAVSMFTAFVEKVFFGHTTYTGIVALAYFSHLVFDMCTLQGVPLLYPFSRSPFVLIGNPSARIRTADHRKEAVAFGIFIAAGFTLQPLFEKGFWTTYNKQFATLRHLHSEFSRSDDMLFVEYEIQEGMFTHKGVGTCIESRESEAWLLDSLGRWIHLHAPTCRRSYPVHTHHRYSIHTETLINITADSLNCFLFGKTIQNIDIQANQPFQYTEPNGFPKQATNYKADHIPTAPQFTILHSPFTIDTILPDQSYLAAIAHLEREITIIQRKQAGEMAQYQQAQQQLAEARSQYAATQDVATRQRLHDEIAELEKAGPPKLDPTRIEELKSQIQKARQEAAIRQAEKREALELKKQGELAGLQETRFTGIVTWVDMYGK
ncbi:MAG: metal-dependent hydrolase [Saprospiraceae bacterium]|nr:metal-dependent hydrolase [Saprospiraceae bacterium]